MCIHNHSLDYILHDSIDPSPMLPPKYGGGIPRGDRVGTGANKQQQSHAQIPLSRTDGDLHRLNIPPANSAAPSGGPLKVRLNFVPLSAVGKIFDYLCNRTFFPPDFQQFRVSQKLSIQFFKINFSTLVHHHRIRVLCVQWHQNSVTGI